MNLHPLDRAALECIHADQCVTNADIGRAIGRHYSTGHVFMARLVSLRLVQRFGASSNRRLLLTPAGYQALGLLPETPTQMPPKSYLLVLAILARNPEAKNPELATAIGRTRDAAGRLLARMEADGYITLSGITRARRAELTEKGFGVVRTVM